MDYTKIILRFLIAKETEREQLSGMSTIAAALAGSLASDSAAGTIAGA
ncbi:TPA: VENN motif pre-toxin domain-containing protein [Salmonella enterica subsp. enterica serovar Java]